MWNYKISQNLNNVMNTICWFLIPVCLVQVFCFSVSWSRSGSHLVVSSRVSLGISFRYLVRIELVEKIMKFPNKHNEETLGRTYKCCQDG